MTLQWLAHIWKDKNMFETGVVRANELMSVMHRARSAGIIRICFRLSST